MTLRRVIEVLQSYADEGVVELDSEVFIKFGKCDDGVPVASISYDEGNVVLCDLEEF